jgi:hypothetical protein
MGIPENFVFFYFRQEVASILDAFVRPVTFKKWKLHLMKVQELSYQGWLWHARAVPSGQ